jgi:bacteriorhodopsin
MPGVTSLSYLQFQATYNIVSFALAAMIFTALYLLVSQGRVLPRYRNALVASATVCGVAAYHYWRIFDSFKDAYVASTGSADEPASWIYNLEVGVGFNEGYRYVDWLLTVPLLLVETIAVLALGRVAQRALLTRLIPASALMIILGYPGEISTDMTTRLVWGTLSTIPFIYILYVLFVELSKSLARQPKDVRDTVGRLRLLLLATWGVYPISYLFPVFGLEDGNSFMWRQIGYSIADVLAKCLYGLVIYKIARLKSFADSSAFAKEEGMN